MVVREGVEARQRCHTSVGGAEEDVLFLDEIVSEPHSMQDTAPSQDDVHSLFTVEGVAPSGHDWWTNLVSAEFEALPRQAQCADSGDVPPDGATRCW